MTMPHLMNCAHSGNGWCLGCVKSLKEELDAAECSHQDEEAAHADTLRLLDMHKQALAELLDAITDGSKADLAEAATNADRLLGRRK